MLPIYIFKNTEVCFTLRSAGNQSIWLHLKPNNHVKAHHGFATDLGSNSRVWACFPRAQPVATGPRVTALEKFCNRYEGREHVNNVFFLGNQEEVQVQEPQASPCSFPTQRTAKVQVYIYLWGCLICIYLPSLICQLYEAGAMPSFAHEPVLTDSGIQQIASPFTPYLRGYNGD